MNTLDAVLLTITVASLCLCGILLHMLKTAMAGVRELGTEALLASRATSSMDLAAASMNMKSFEDDRQQLVVERRKMTEKKEKADAERPSEPLLPDGTPMHLLRPL